MQLCRITGLGRSGCVYSQGGLIGRGRDLRWKAASFERILQ